MKELFQFLKRDQLFIFLGIFILVIFSWIYLFYSSSTLPAETSESIIQDMVMPQVNNWNINDVLALFVMWSVMMMAMMLPSATPMILIFSTINKKKNERGNGFVPTWTFLSGYILVWIGFSIIAVIIQWILHYFALMSSDFKLINPSVSGIVLIAAGVYQFTPIKNACLRHCQTPLGFIMGNWRYGKRGALIMGLKHGLYCVGCCWVLMSLLFLAGIMNILWIALIAVFILIEKIVRRDRYVSYAAGFALMMLGSWLII